VILVAPFTAERSAAGWAAVTDRLAAHAAGLTLVWLHLPAERLVDRLSRRAAARDAEKVRDPAAFLATVDPEPPAVDHLALDATLPIADLVDRVVAELARPRLAIDGTP
jgi:hypothetical protein